MEPTRSTRRPRGGRTWHSAVPFGLGHTKPRHFREMLRIAWENRDNLPHAWRVLTRGVCDGCALGTSGLSDWTIEGTHLCLVRLNLLRLNTAPALDAARLADVSKLVGATSADLRALGRLPVPMRRRRGERGFSPVTWQEVWADVGPRWRALDPARTFFFVTSRGLTNESYYAAGKVARRLGTNNVDNSARLCHAASTAAMKSALGRAASTCSYRDFWEADLVVFAGSNPANDQPVAMKYLLEAKKRGARVVSINAYREPGMERYWVPSNASSALFGTRIVDRFHEVRVGGDLALFTALAQRLLARGAVDETFVRGHTEGFDAWRRDVESQDPVALLALAGTTSADVDALADEFARARRGILVWSMGLTQHAHGADTVRSFVHLGLLRGWVGKPGTGLVPIRGHSGVQGGAEMGAYATAFPGAIDVDAESAAELSLLWGFPVPSEPGLDAVEMLEAAERGELDALYCSGGNFLETMPEPRRIETALARIGLRVHTDIVVSSQMLVPPADVAYLLPAQTRYEQSGGGTETSTERRVIFSPEIPRKDLPHARAEWRILSELARAVRPDIGDELGLSSSEEIRREIERVVPEYRGIAALSRQGDQFQWGGPLLFSDGVFATASGKARFASVRAPGLDPDRTAELAALEYPFVLATRRGKQFNSMVQDANDPLTGADRDHVFIHPADAARLGLEQDAPLILVNERARFAGRAFLAPVALGTLQGHWPEVNPLIAAGRRDRDGGVPDYNARVRVEPG
jgi:molybdopterin-dependent oxidoreductase alpha subunit